jgi:hypothetical protein
MNKVLKYIDEIVKGSYQPIEDRFSNFSNDSKDKNGYPINTSGGLDYQNSRRVQAVTGVVEVVSAFSLPNTPSSLPIGAFLTIDGVSRIMIGEGVVAASRTVGRDIAKYFRRSYAQ